MRRCKSCGIVDEGIITGDLSRCRHKHYVAGPQGHDWEEVEKPTADEAKRPPTLDECRKSLLPGMPSRMSLGWLEELVRRW